MLRQLRMDVWWPGMDKDVKVFTSTCWACAASTPTTCTPPMAIRDTPERVWSEVQADFKGPVGGRYYFHVVIDQFSRWPKVSMVSSTSFDKLKPALERSWGLLGIPDKVTHDNGPPYNSQRWRDYAKEKGFELNPCTPEHPRANGIVERFMGVLVKTVHSAIAAGKDVQTEVQRRLLNYRNTPHPSTGKTPAELIMLRRTKTKIPSMRKINQSDIHREARQRDAETRAHRKQVFDKKHKVREQIIQPGDQVLIKQQKTTVKPPFDPTPYDVTEVKGSQVTARRGDKMRIRNMAKVKLIRKRPAYLVAGQSKREEQEEEDYTFIDLSGAGNKAAPPIQLLHEEDQGQQLELPVGGAEGAAVQQQAHGTPRREEWVVANGPWREKPSPRERKRRQMAARRRDKEQRDIPYQLRSRGAPRAEDEEEELV